MYEMISKCLICGGKTVKKIVTTENWWGEKLTIVENVPAWVCDTCGEQFFEPRICEELDRLRDTPPVAKRTIQVPVYSFPGKASLSGRRTPTH